jgi:uncharacterized protein (DUF1778 family)
MKATSDDRVDLRLPAALKERFRRVAALSGRSMKDFIVASALDKADEIDASVERWKLDAEDSRIVMDVLLHRRDLPGLRALLAETSDDAIEAKKLVST